MDVSQSLKQDLTRHELERKSNDSILVHNPTNEDYTARWDRNSFRVPAATVDVGYGLGNAVLPRYIARNYVKHQADAILSQRGNEAIKLENEKRQKKGMPKMNLWEQQEEFERPYRIDNADARAPLIRQLWLGVYKEFGRDIPLPDNTPLPSDRRTVDEQLMEEIEAGQGFTEINLNTVTPTEEALEEVAES